MAPGGAPVAGARGGIPQGQLSQEQFNKLQDYAQDAKRLTKEDKAKGKTLEQVLAEDKIAAAALAKSMSLSCEVTDAMRVAAGPETVDGKTVQTQTYETTCSNGMGYFLVSQEPAKPYGFSCFATDATAKADIAAKRKPTEICRLPGNADLKAVAAKMLTASGHVCKVKDFKWSGQNAANHIEFDEVACDDGQGYMMVVGLPGASIPVHVETCNQSAKRGLPCKLSDNGDIGPTLKSFRDTLAKNKIACEATDQTTRVVGQIEAKKLYVVEFACPQMPKGIVAYIPHDDSKWPFEVVDCPTAAKRGAVCALPGNKK
ncbi:hypothetical protein [Rhizomicrobium electricum]|jgi:hypothetical protein|uniref:SAG family member n=1 Tax=Rhizomicrobium electricum TaxID=480070 RepID=A0ABN1EQA7_9PROT|nr:hypothetical protein [Rhizomicrobium electricum]NIJ48905.1 hypothetical protein [Rhizomicrobium electricum]